MKDIETKADIEKLVRAFYENLFKIEDMKRVFKDTAFEDHVPHIVHFWSFVLLDEEGYKTNVFDKHLHLSIHADQFDTWLKVFEGTVRENYAGEKAEMAILRATSLAYTFKTKWQSLNK